MEGVNFIPKSNSQGNIRTSKPRSPESKIILFAAIVILPAVVVIGGLYYFAFGYLDAEIATLEERNQSFKAEYESVLPSELEVGEFLASLEEILDDDQRVSATFAELQPDFLSSLVVNSVSYQNATNLLSIQASIDTFDLSGQQLTLLRENESVASADFVGQRAVNSQTGRVDFTLEIRLK